jgi:hypothetical protein
LGGSSAGALVAALIGTDIPIKKALEACHTINDQWGGAMSFTGGITESLFNFDLGGGPGTGNTHEEAVAAALAAGVVLPPPVIKNMRTGNSKTLKALLHEVLDDVLPKDAHLRLNARAGKVRREESEGGRLACLCLLTCVCFSFLFVFNPFTHHYLPSLPPSLLPSLPPSRSPSASPN